MRQKIKDFLQWSQSEGLSIKEQKPIPYGTHLVITNGKENISVNIYDKGTTLIQGKKNELQDRIKFFFNSLANTNHPHSKDTIKTQKKSSNQDMETSTSRKKQPAQEKDILSSLAEKPRIGIDEAGKGDYFGPLVIAAVFIREEQANLLLNYGVRDSKKIADTTILKLYDALKEKFIHEIITIMPIRYNSLYQKIGNLNHLLAWGHARALENILAIAPSEIAISDQFASPQVLQKSLMTKGRQINLIQCPKAERDGAVALASIFARAQFLSSMEFLKEQHRMTFNKGATHVIDNAKKFVSKFGRDRLGEVAKLHFKTTQKI